MSDYFADPEISGLVSAVSRTVGRRFAEFTSRDDLSQEIWSWVYTHPSKMSEWESLGDDGYRKLKRAFYHVATGYAQEQKSQRLGYRTSDLFYYKTGTFRRCLPTLFQNGMDVDAEAYADFGDRALWLDLINAVNELPESDYRLVARVFQGDPDESIYTELAIEMDVSPAAVRGRVNRILARMQRTLGGPRPDPEDTGHRRRKVMSNARALAETRSQYDD